MTPSRPQLALLALALLAGGCVPMKFSGYRATGNGSLEGGYCIAGIDNRLRVRAPAGVELLVYATAHGHRAAVLLNVDFSVPEGTTVQWESPRLGLHSPEWTRPRTWMIDRVVSGRSTYDATALLAGSSQPRARTFSLTFYSTEMGTPAEPAIPPAATFTLELPALKINGVPFDPGPVTFEAYREWGVYTCAQ